MARMALRGVLVASLSLTRCGWAGSAMLPMPASCARTQRSRTRDEALTAMPINRQKHHDFRRMTFILEVFVEFSETHRRAI